MNQQDLQIPLSAEAAEEIETAAFVPEGTADTPAWEEAVLFSEAEAEALRGIYPDFDPQAALADPILGALLRRETAPSLRQLYEAVHLEEIVDARVAAELEARVSAAVASAVKDASEAAARETEERLLAHIRARGQRPAENGVRAASGIRMHPAVSRLTRRERALLAKRAEDGETINL